MYIYKCRACQNKVIRVFYIVTFTFCTYCIHVTVTYDTSALK